MSHTLSKAALVLLAILPLPVSAQQTGAGTPGRMTLKLRRPAWFGFALDCQAVDKLTLGAPIELVFRRA
jgi:hypothetical protein